jgi:hypothetical protein
LKIPLSLGVGPYGASVVWSKMTIAWADVIAVAPELSTAPIGMQTSMLAQVNRRCPLAIWGDESDTGRTYLAAHLAALGMRRGIGGPVTSQTAGPVSQSYGILVNEGLLSSTAYGQEYLRLLRTLPLARLPIIGGCTLT